MSQAEKFKGRRGEPGRYRVIDTRVWDLLHGQDGDTTRLFFYCWARPHSTPYGILRLLDGYALVDLGWTAEQLAGAWERLRTADLIWRDGDLCVIVPFVMSNPPANRDVVKHWSKAVTTLPASRLFTALYQRASAWVTEEGLAWLAAKVDTVSDTVSTLRTQNSGLRAQGSELRAQETGGRGQGTGVRGRGGGEGTGRHSLRSAGRVGFASRGCAWWERQRPGRRRQRSSKADALPDGIFGRWEGR